MKTCDRCKLELPDDEFGDRYTRCDACMRKTYSRMAAQQASLVSDEVYRVGDRWFRVVELDGCQVQGCFGHTHATRNQAMACTAGDDW